MMCGIEPSDRLTNRSLKEKFGIYTGINSAQRTKQQAC